MLGSTALVLDGLKMQPHASHFSVPQAIEYALEYTNAQSANGQDAPLVLFTDMAHRMEHSSSEAALQKLVAGLSVYRADHADAAGHWWEAVWDARQNEHSDNLALTSGGGVPATGTPLVPQMHFSYDGMCVDFCKNVV